MSPTSAREIASASRTQRGSPAGSSASAPRQRDPGHRLATTVLALAGIALVVYALVAPVLRDAENFVSGRAMLPFAAGLAVLAAAWSRGALAQAAAWGALFIIGQAASLQLIDAGIILHYQHYRPWPELLQRPIPVAIIAAQSVVVAVGLARRAPAAAAWIRTTMGTWRAVLLVAALVLTSATLSENVTAYVHELITSSFVQLVAIGNLVVFVAAIPRETIARFAAWADRALGPAERDGAAPPEMSAPRRIDRFALACALCATVVCALLAAFAYGRQPHVIDEVSYLFQARYFASGALALTPPPVPDAFSYYLVEAGARGWYSVVPPGWPAVLAIGAKLGAAWLVNPVLTGVNVLLAWLFLARLYDLRTARIATLLLALSPMHLFLGMSYMAHALTLTCALGAALAVDHARRTGARWPTWLGGLLVGLAALARQMDGLIFAICLGLWAIGFGGRRIRLTATIGLVLGTVIGVSAVLPYNRYFTGSATTFPIMEYNDRMSGVNANAYGFGADRGMGWALDPNPGHSPLDATINANLNTTAMSVELLGWSLGSLLLVYFLVLRGRLTRADRAMLGVIALTFVAYFFNYYSGGPDFGARYWFPMLLPLVALSARGLVELGRLPGEAAVSHGDRAQARALAAGALLCASATMAFIPWRIVDKYHHFLGVRTNINQVAADHDFGRALVLVRGSEDPGYSSVAPHNPLNTSADVPVYARDLGPQVRADLARAFPDRPVWIIDGPTAQGAGFRVVAGPLPPGSLVNGTEAQGVHER